jgi:predicted phage-related endonuclease
MSKTTSVMDEAHWHELRSKHVGGSEISSLFYQWQAADGCITFRHMFEDRPEDATLLGCCSPYLTGYRLFHIKAGILQPDKIDNERIDAGIFLEPAIAEWARKKWSWSLRKVHRYLSPMDGMGCSRDYESVEKGFPPVEFKNVDFMQFKDKWIADGDEIITPPLHIILQLQHQIAATDADHGWIVACVGGNELKRGRIERHEPTIQRIKAAVSRFWIGVQAGEKPHGFEDYDTVADIFAYGTKDKHIDLTGDNELPVLCRSFLDLKHEKDSAEDRLEAVKAAITARMGDSTRATANGFTLSWPAAHREEKIIPQKIQPAKDWRQGLTIKQKD